MINVDLHIDVFDERLNYILTLHSFWSCIAKVLVKKLFWHWQEFSCTHQHWQAILLFFFCDCYLCMRYFKKTFLWIRCRSSKKLCFELDVGKTKNGVKIEDLELNMIPSHYKSSVCLLHQLIFPFLLHQLETMMNAL